MDGSLPRPRRAARWASVVLLALSVPLMGCDSGGGGSSMDDTGLNCSFPVDFLNEGANRGSITPVNDPALVDGETAETELPAFSDSDRVLGLPPSFHDAYNNTPLAVPLDVLFESEVMNLDGWASRPLAITFCPLTSSTVVFDREAIDGARFEISGLLLNKGNEDHSGNLVMVDTESGESLWPQMSLGAVCGPDRGTTLTTLPAIEMRWDRWKELYPNTEVAIERDMSETSGTEDRALGQFHTADAATKQSVPLGRVLGIPSRARVGGGTGGLAVAFQDLDNERPLRVAEVTVSREDMVVFWDREARSAMAFTTTSTFSVQNGEIVDNATQSTWTVDGRAIEGARQGEQLDPAEGAFIADGRAWFDFQPDSDRWNSSQ